MNFLSHFYFDRHAQNPERILGIVLPDLLKNTDKSWVAHPNKYRDLMTGDPGLFNILEGWNRHLIVDQYFHSSDFFYTQTKKIRTAIMPLLINSPVRPSFLAHIALELMLDGLLITQKMINTHKFYELLASADPQKIAKFLRISQIEHPGVFLDFLEKFISSAYLHSYEDHENVIYALGQICRRLWNNPFNDQEQLNLKSFLSSYQKELSLSFMVIFDEIDSKLN